MMTTFRKTKHNQGVHGSVTLALTRSDPLILVTCVWLEHVGNLSGAYSHVSPSSDFIMKCLQWWGRHLCWLTRDSSSNFPFFFQGCPHAWVNTHKRLSCGRKWAWPRVKFVNVCVCALSSRQTSSETRRAEIRERRLTWDATPETCLVAVTSLPGNVKP